jgi:hypothetical protein
MTQETVEFGNWGRCARLASKSIELLVTLDFGPRIIRFGFIDGQNLLKESPEVIGATDEWVNYGGHRLWHAPEVKPRTYAPDNRPVTPVFEDGTLSVKPPPETENGIQKEMQIRLIAENEVKVLHRITNLNPWAVELAPWALSVMAPGGTAIIPQEEYKPHTAELLPARPLVLWHYTDMTDPRFTWGRDYILLRQDPASETPQKFGVLNKKGAAAYLLNRDLFIKRFDPQAEARFPDYGCNTELFTNAAMLEVESLAPLQQIEPGGCATHTETWALTQLAHPVDSAAAIMAAAKQHGL